MTTIEILQGALALLKQGPEKWLQHAYSDVSFKLVSHRIEEPTFYDYRPGSTCFCLDGAIQAAAPSLRKASPAQDSMASYLGWSRKMYGEDSNAYLWEWNDNPFRTYEEVIEAVEGCISHLQSKQ